MAEKENRRRSRSRTKSNNREKDAVKGLEGVGTQGTKEEKGRGGEPGRDKEGSGKGKGGKDGKERGGDGKGRTVLCNLYFGTGQCKFGDRCKFRHQAEEGSGGEGGERGGGKKAGKGVGRGSGGGGGGGPPPLPLGAPFLFLGELVTFLGPAQDCLWGGVVAAEGYAIKPGQVGVVVGEDRSEKEVGVVVQFLGNAGPVTVLRGSVGPTALSTRLDLLKWAVGGLEAQARREQSPATAAVRMLEHEGVLAAARLESQKRARERAMEQAKEATEKKKKLEEEKDQEKERKREQEMEREKEAEQEKEIEREREKEKEKVEGEEKEKEKEKEEAEEREREKRAEKEKGEKRKRKKEEEAMARGKKKEAEEEKQKEDQKKEEQ